jgi:enoyl-CoA hydratase/carnithine racemase
MNVLTNAAARQYADGKLLQSVGEGIAILTINNPEKRNATPG